MHLLPFLHRPYPGRRCPCRGTLQDHEEQRENLDNRVAISRPVQAVGVKYYVAESESRGVYFIVRESESTAQLTL